MSLLSLYSSRIHSESLFGQHSKNYFSWIWNRKKDSGNSPNGGAHSCVKVKKTVKVNIHHYLYLLESILEDSCCSCNWQNVLFILELNLVESYVYRKAAKLYLLEKFMFIIKLYLSKSHIYYKLYLLDWIV